MGKRFPAACQFLKNRIIWQLIQNPDSFKNSCRLLIITTMRNIGKEEK